MARDRKSLTVLVALALSVFLPPYTSVPFQQQDTPLLVKEVILKASSDHSWLSPLSHITTMILLLLVYLYGEKMGRITDAYFAALFLFFAFSNCIAVTEHWGLTVLSGNLVPFLAVSLFWLWEAYKPRNTYVFQRLPLWRYWVVPFAFLAFWFPADANLGPNFDAALLLTSDYGVFFCPTTPVALAILTLIYPRVNNHLLRVTSFVGLMIGLFNALSVIVMPGYTLWALILHVQLILISSYSLLIPRLAPRVLGQRGTA